MQRPRHATSVLPRRPADPSARRVRRSDPRGPASRAARTGQLATAAAVAALVLATWPLLGPAAAGTGPVGPTALVAHASGMLAGGGVLLVLLLVARTPLLELGVGADVLTRWHARAGRVVVVLVLVHAVAAVLVRQEADGTGTGAALAAMAGQPWLLAALVGTALLLVAAAASVRAARRRTSYEAWHAVHLLMHAAVALGFGHQLAGPDLAGHPVLQVGWALAYTHTAGIVVHHRVLTPLRQARRHRLHVAEVRQEAPGVTTVVVTGQHLGELRAQPGQFFRWRFLTRRHWRSAHPFSLSAAPTATSLRLTAKAVGDGSSSLAHLPVGTRVVAEGPYGAVTPARRTRRNVLLVAAGVGITPMRALFEAIPVRRGEDVLLLYRPGGDGEALFEAELLEIAARTGARVHVDRRPDRGLLSPGPLLELVPDLAERDVYACGPAAVVDAVRRCARAAGAPASRVHEERFTL